MATNLRSREEMRVTAPARLCLRSYRRNLLKCEKVGYAFGLTHLRYT